MTTGLLLDDLSPPDQAAGEADEGPMGQLRRRLTLLQGAQVTRALGLLCACSGHPGRVSICNNSAQCQKTLLKQLHLSCDAILSVLCTGPQQY